MIIFRSPVTLDGRDLQRVQAAITGTTATNADLQNISQDDFVRTAVIMLRLKGMLDQEGSGITLYGWCSIVCCLYGAASKNVVDKSSYI